MYPHFVVVHNRATGVKCLVNIDQIVWVGDKMGGCVLRMTGGDMSMIVTETYDEVAEMIRGAGALIRKADPRLDETKALDWDEMIRPELVGEPVWNSNTRKWYLVIDSALDGSWAEMAGPAGERVRMEPHDLKKFPLYRMRK